MSKKKATKRKTEVFAFPTRVKCPGCGCLNNYALETRGRIQIRTCRTVKCKHNTMFPGREPFKVTGKKPELPI